jgi:hypothetical protein
MSKWLVLHHSMRSMSPMHQNLMLGLSLVISLPQEQVQEQVERG